MKVKQSRVMISPRIICWYGMPSYFTEKEKFNFLKRDIFLFSPDNQQLPGLRGLNGKKSAFLFNLDYYLGYFTSIGYEAQLGRIRKLAKYLSLFCSHNSLVYSRSLDPQVESIFEEFGIQFLQADLQYREAAYSILQKRIFPFISMEGDKLRQFVRIQFHKDTQFKVHIRNLTHELVKTMVGTLKDISLNGMGIYFRDYRYFKTLRLRDCVTLQVKTSLFTIHVKSAFITRRRDVNEEIGVNYNIFDTSFVDRQDAELITKTVYHYLEDFAYEEIQLAENKETELALLQ